MSVKYVTFYETADGMMSRAAEHFPAHKAAWSRRTRSGNGRRSTADSEPGAGSATPGPAGTAA